ncbi:MAG: fumarylacetoacetate hydrolase family protein [Comamonadaceae bacterium]|nr:fumarylacetoacetate hydrolase family protein [Comamonadaceae bacterium]
MQHVYGYTIVNDVTSRRLQRRHQQWFLGKSLDGFCPLGPAILTADEVPDVRALRVRTTGSTASCARTGCAGRSDLRHPDADRDLSSRP